MSKEFVSKWYSNIPEPERDLPVMYYKGKVYSPNDIYREVMDGTKLGDELQEKLEHLASPHTFDYGDVNELKKVAELRAKKIVENLPKDFSIVSLSGEVIDKDELLKRLRKSAVNFEMKKVMKLLRGTNDEVPFP